MKGSIKTPAPTAPVSPTKPYKLSSDGRALFYSTGNTIAFDVVDENSDVYFIIYHQINDLKKCYAQSISIIGKDQVEGAR